MLNLFYHHVSLSVIPKIIPFIFGEEPSNYGESSTVQCSISLGDMPIEFSWFLKGKPIDKSQEGLSIVSFGKKTTVLSIDSLTEKFAGNYTCLAQNNAGYSTYSAELIVKGILIINYIKLTLYY